MRVLSIAVDAANQTRPVRVFFRPHQTKTYAMDEPSYWWQTGVGIVLAGFAWIGNRAVQKVDAHEERIKTLEAESVTEADLDKTIRRFEDTLSDTNKTVIEIWKHLAEKK